MGSVTVSLKLAGGASAYPFSVTVTSSEQSPVSAKGNNVLCQLTKIYRLHNRWC